MGQPQDPPNPRFPQQESVPVSPPARRRGPLAIGVLAGFLVAVIIGGILAAVGVLHVGATRTEPARVSAEPITLPSSLPGYQDYITALAAVQKSGSSTADSRASQMVAAQTANRDKIAGLTLAAYQKANPGAAVAVRQYADAALQRQFSVIAVRTGYPGLTNGVVIDPAALQLAVAPQRIQSFGDVQCLVANASTPAGQQPDPQQMFTTVCQRTGPALTVLVYGGSFTGADGQQAIIGVTNAAWSAVAG